MTNILLNKDGRYVKMENVSLSSIPSDERIWIQLTNPNEIEVRRIVDELKIPEDFVRSALDDEEGPRLDEDDDTHYTLTVFDIPVIQREADSDAPYTTIPLSIIQKGNLTVTVCLQENFKFHEIKQGTLRTNILLDSKKITYQFLLAFHSLYEVYLRAIDKTSSRFESKLMESRDADTNLRGLMRFKNALIYFASSLRQNIVVAEKLMIQKNLTEDDVETLENITVEIKQAFATCNLQRELMTETMSTYSNLISNQLAERMRLLTIVTIILAIPTLIAGIYGMNINLPFDHLANLGSFFLIISFTLIICILVAIWMIPNRHLLKPKKKRVTCLKTKHHHPKQETNNN
ncbi:MAG: magnesium transporter CorA family protein [Clostridia bacterium]|nr:magnesium transporter CorA family protein [Clostridia bacterium]